MTPSAVDNVISSLQARIAEVERQATVLRARIAEIAADITKVDKESAALQKQLHELVAQLHDAEVRSKKMDEELKDVKALVKEARSAAQSLTQAQITEMVKMLRPPAAVKTTLEGVFMLLNSQAQSTLTVEWRVVQSFLAKKNIVQEIMRYPGKDHMSTHPLNDNPAVRAHLVSLFLDTLTEENNSTIANGSNPYGSMKTPEENWKTVRDAVTGPSPKVVSLTAVKRASKPCGELYRWLTAQLRLAGVLRDCGPLLAQLDDLLAEVKMRQHDVDETQKAIMHVTEKGDGLEREKKAKGDELDGLLALLEDLMGDLRSKLSAVSETEVKVTIKERIQFGRNSTDVSPINVDAINGVISRLRHMDDVKICVEGHADADEDDSIAAERAERVNQVLLENGMPVGRTRTAAYHGRFNVGRAVTFSVIQEFEVKGTVQFGKCSADIEDNENNDKLLRDIAKVLDTRRLFVVRIEGHTDPNPNWGCTNQELSEQRANAVKENLVSRGIDADTLQVQGFGEDKPIASNDDQLGRARNRRVEFHIENRDSQYRIQEMLRNPASRRKIANDSNTVNQLREVATGLHNEDVKRAAADVLAACGLMWPIERLFYIAMYKEDPERCPAAILYGDVVKEIVRHLVMTKQ